MRFILILFLSGIINRSYAQDITFARKIVDTLTSPCFWGRGYTKDGATKSAKFLSDQFQSYGLKPLNDKSFLQEFTFSVNTFPGKMEVAINNLRLTPGRDFIIGPDSRGIKESCKLEQKDSVTYVNEEKKIIVSLKDKLTWSVAQQSSGYTHILVDKKSVPNDLKRVKLNIENKLIQSFNAYNVCGVVRGTAKPDSIIMITAHYDHLGGMGSEVYFPGANDNASGVALLLDLAKYYASNPPKYSVVFICFGGEEAGLVGSRHFAESPLLDLKSVRFLINTDLAGTGEEGITVVNATVFKKEFALLGQLNDQNKYIVKINPRGKAANSDHYWFTEKGVPSFFIYTMGGIKAYHDIYDRAATLPLTEYEDLFRLITRFNKALME